MDVEHPGNVLLCAACGCEDLVHLSYEWILYEAQHSHDSIVFHPDFTVGEDLWALAG
jgi:hypothetical protein